MVRAAEPEYDAESGSPLQRRCPRKDAAASKVNGSKSAVSRFDIMTMKRDAIHRIQDWQIMLTAFPQITAESSGSPALTAAFVPQHFYFAGR